jgi:predicted component of type VI protein secretion system
MMNLSKSFTRSTLGMSCVSLLLLTTSLPSHANDSDRITQLEKQVQELKLRLNNLETKTSASAQQRHAAVSQSDGSRPTASVQQAPVASKTDMKVLEKWRSLEKGMSPDQVRAVLGEPQKTQTNNTFSYWDYANQGSLTFAHGRLNGWTEPN